MEIWSYQDERLPPEQLYNLQLSADRAYITVYNFEKNLAFRLETGDDIGMWPVLNNGGNDNYLLRQSNFCYSMQSRLPEDQPVDYLVNTIDGTRKPIVKGEKFNRISFSTSGKYTVWYSYKSRAYFSYNLTAGITKNITANIPFDIDNEVEAGKHPYGLAFWGPGDEALYLYDRYDIWKVDPAGKKLPVNITNGYGRKNKTILRYAYQPSGMYDFKKTISGDSTIFLCGFDEQTKKNGFFKKKINKSGDPIQLSMFPEDIFFPEGLSHVSLSTFIFKAKSANVFLLKRMSATEFPNLYVTKDFIKYRKNNSS